MNNCQFLIIKPTTKCNFNCTFCSAKNLSIPFQFHVPEVLKNYILNYRPKNLIITGGEPLINTEEYFKELIEIMKSIESNYSISLTSNMVLWYENPERYDYLFKNPHIGVITSFQYGGERKDETDYSEERFIDLFNKFYKRYNIKLNFIYVVNKNNEHYILKACELAKRLGVKLKINQILPLGGSKEFYPRYKILDWHIKAIEAGYKDQLDSFNSILDGKCNFSPSYKYCECSRVVYVDNYGKLQESYCEDIISANEKIELNNKALFTKCYMCKLFSLCNGCSSNKHFSEQIKEEQCKWMQENRDKLEKYGFIQR